MHQNTKKLKKKTSRNQCRVVNNQGVEKIIQFHVAPGQDWKKNVHLLSQDIHNIKVNSGKRLLLVICNYLRQEK